MILTLNSGMNLYLFMRHFMLNFIFVINTLTVKYTHIIKLRFNMTEFKSLSMYLQQILQTLLNPFLKLVQNNKSTKKVLDSEYNSSLKQYIFKAIKILLL